MVHTPHYQTPYITPYIVHANHHGVDDSLNNCTSFNFLEFLPPSGIGGDEDLVLHSTSRRSYTGLLIIQIVSRNSC